MVAFYKGWPWNKRKRINVLTFIRLKDEANFFIESFLEVLYFPSTIVVKTKNLDDKFLRTFLILCFQSVGSKSITYI